MATLTVGPGQQFSTIAAAVAASHDGDIVQVQAGTYVNDFATIDTRITLQGVGGMVQMVNQGGFNLAEDKAMFVVNNDVTIDHFEFQGAMSWDANGAGIRYQAGALTVTNSYFHDNQNGILGAANAQGSVFIQNSEFFYNGNYNEAQSAGTHDVYLNDIRQLTIDNSYFHDLGNDYNHIKSRAEATTITNTRVYDGPMTDDWTSYEVDVPNGGVLRMEHNIILQSVDSQNPVIIDFGGEGLTYGANSIYLNDNIILNELEGAPLGVADFSNTAGQLLNTQLFGLTAAELATAAALGQSGTSTLSAMPALDYSHPWIGAPAQATAAPVAPGSLQVIDAPYDGVALFSGATTPFAMVLAYEGDKWAGGGSAGSDGRFQFMSTGALADGAHTFTFTASNVAGSSQSLNVTFTETGGHVSDLVTDPGSMPSPPPPVPPPPVPPPVSPPPPPDPPPPESSPPVSPAPVDGDQTLIGTAGDDSLTGGSGNDSIAGGDGTNVLFGGDGDDQIFGGAGFDRMNGNVGDDTLRGGGGNDWVLGGKNDDQLFGDDGADILNGNLGNDTADGGAGDDTVRGGQGDDVLSGGAGNDYLSGDLGNDTLTGGDGADAFRVFAGGGNDLITDFNAQQGDHLVLDPGTTYTAAQVGSDVVLTLNGGAQVTLAHVTLSTLPAGWVVGG